MTAQDPTQKSAQKPAQKPAQQPAQQPTSAHTARSKELFERARQLTPGGVNSPVRGRGAVGGQPRCLASAHGAPLVDADGNGYGD